MPALNRALHIQQAFSISSELLSAAEHPEISKEKRNWKAVYRRRGSPPLRAVSSLGKLFNTLAAILVLSLLVSSFLALLATRHLSGAGGAPTLGVPATNGALPPSTATSSPIPPTSVKLRVSALVIPPTTQGNITIPAGTTVTLTVVPDHSLRPFQIFTMGIYATDPYGFSELKDCTYPNTDTCSYTVAYSASENTDYTHGTHTFRAFLGNIGGRILANSDSITITWSCVTACPGT